jgi:predicted NBD/HSP70 family sugar kinase
MLNKFLNDQSIQNRPLKLIYQYIYQNRSVSRADIINKTNLNRGKVARSLKELLDKGYIQTEGYGDSEGGRPPSLYQINPICSYIIGIQITRVETKMALFDLNLNKLDEKKIIMTSKHKPQIVIEEIKNMITEFMKTYHFTVNELLGIGIGAIGPLDRERGVILQSEPFLTHSWNNIPIVEQIKSEFPVRIQFDNAANTIVLGEYRNHQAYKNILNVTVGWTWGCAVILDRKLMRVESGDISGYGHMVINMDGKKCYCGKTGCMTAYTSLYVILDKIKERSPGFFYEKLKDFAPAEQIINIISEEDVRTKEVILDSAKYIGVGVANLATVFHSELVLVNGPLISQYPGYYEEIIHHVSLNLNEQKNIQFRKGNFQSGVLGTAVQVLDSYMNE